MHAQTSPDLSRSGAAIILSAFDRFQATFASLTDRAGDRFRHRDWAGMRRDAVERLGLYGVIVRGAVRTLHERLGGEIRDRSLWAAMNVVYATEVSERADAELAETFFNSITRRIFTTVGVDPQIEFVDATFGRGRLSETVPSYRRYRDEGCLGATICQILNDHSPAPLTDVTRDAQLVAAEFERAGLVPADGIEMLDAVFYRGKGAYLIGRVPQDIRYTPLVIALINDRNGVAVDAVLLTEPETSVVFSFAHSYFHVSVASAQDIIQFLRSIMPQKPISDLYSAIGYNKHAKTELFRDILRHMRSTTDLFELAPGIPGLVMSVFTMPSYDVVFKVIRDDIAEPKRTTPDQVKDCYRLVFKHDRAGRLTEAQEFEHLAFDRHRFSEAVLADLRDTASRTVTITRDLVTIKHLYIERRMRPLDLFIREDPIGAREAMLDYGNALKDLAATNIFPGDPLLKNFGVTRHRRVIFYDYDEVSLLTDCNFRTMPPASCLEDELGADPWFHVGPADVFPEEFPRFLGLSDSLRDYFLAEHQSLFTAKFWQDMQNRSRAGEVLDVFPYRAERRVRK